MGQRLKNDQGDEVELVNGRWIPVPKEASGPAEKGPKALGGGTLRILGLGDTGIPLPESVEGALASAGDQFETAKRNVRDWVAMARGDEGAQRQIAAERVEAQRTRERLHDEAPIASMVGAALPTAPLMLLGGPLLAGGGGALRTAAAGAAESAGLGALQSESGEYGADALMGGAMSAGTSLGAQIVGRVQAGRRAIAEAQQQAGGVAGALGTTLSDAEREVIDGAKRAGMTVLPGQETGNATARKIEAGLAANPFTSGAFDAIQQGNKDQLNRLAARAMGVEADNVGQAVRAQAEHQIGEQFKDVGKRLGYVDLDPLISKVRTMAQEEMTAPYPRMQVNTILSRLEQGAEGRAAAAAGEAGGALVPGAKVMDLRSQFARKMRDAYKANNSDLGELYGQVLDHLDDTIKDAAGRAARTDAHVGDWIVDSYSQARDRWSVLRAMDRGGASADGNVFPGQAARIMKDSDKSRFWGRADEAGQSLAAKGTGTIGEAPLGDFYDALRFHSSQIGKPIVPNTGGTVGAFNQWLNSGGTAASLTKGAIGRLGSEPLMRAYANQSPMAAQVMYFTQQAMSGNPVPPGAFTASQGLARALGTFGQ